LNTQERDTVNAVDPHKKTVPVDVADTSHVSAALHPAYVLFNQRPIPQPITIAAKKHVQAGHNLIDNILNNGQFVDPLATTKRNWREIVTSISVSKDFSKSSYSRNKAILSSQILL
jgi:hypothetical protein